MKNIYKKIYDNNKNLGQLENNPRIRMMLKIIDSLNINDSNILDVGCYDGTFLSQIINRRNFFYGIEASDFGVVESSKKGIIVKQFFFNDSESIPFENNFFDIIVAGEIIEHIFDTDFFLDEVYRILRSNGKLLISTPNIASLGRRMMLLFGVNPIIELSPNEKDSSGHIRYFTKKTLDKLLNKHNFNPIIKMPDIVNLSLSGKFRSKRLAKLMPNICQSLIGLYEKK